MERGTGMEVFLFPAAKDLPPAACGKGSASAGCKFNQLPIPAKAGISLSSNCFGGAMSERQLEIGEIPAFAGMERGEWKFFLFPAAKDLPSAACGGRCEREAVAGVEYFL